MFKNKYLNYLSYLIVFITIFGYEYITTDNEFLERTASNEQEIGENISMLIFYVLMLIFIMSQLIKFKIKFENELFNNILIINMLVYLTLLPNIGSLSLLRISFSIFFLLLPYLALITEKSFLQKTTSQMIFFHLSLFPLFTVAGPF